MRFFAYPGNLSSSSSSSGSKTTGSCGVDDSVPFFLTLIFRLAFPFGPLRGSTGGIRKSSFNLKKRKHVSQTGATSALPCQRYYGMVAWVALKTTSLANRFLPLFSLQSDLLVSVVKNVDAFDPRFDVSILDFVD